MTDENDESDSTDHTSTRDTIESGVDRAVTEFDAGLVDALSWLLDTETRARIYVNLRESPGSTSEEVANGTGLYPSTVRESLAELHEEGVVEREKRETEGAGNNPYEYTAIAPSDLIRGLVGQLQDDLNAIVNMDDFLGDETASEHEEPITIVVEDEDET